MPIEKDFDIRFVSALALREKQVQQNYRPIIAVHKWFARRPGTLFRSLVLAEFVPGSVEESFYKPHSLPQVTIADPFMGGGTPLVEANRLGCRVHGCDINPLSWWIVKEEIEHIDVALYRKAADALLEKLQESIGAYYATTCLCCGSHDALVKYFLWVKTLECQQCGHGFDLFPGYLLAENTRHPLNVLVCAKCGQLTESADRKRPGTCQACKSQLFESGPASRGSCQCPSCGHKNRFPQPGHPPCDHRLFAIEYHCHACKPRHKGRFFKKPDADDLAKVASAFNEFVRLTPRFVPDDAIPPGDETDRLLSWGMTQYQQLFNGRQLLGLELSARYISEVKNERIRNALATNLSDLLRYQNMLCRYDTMALKSLDIFSVHGFPVGLIECESNFLGFRSAPNGVPVGSGGWLNMIEKYAKAKLYCDHPFEIDHSGDRKREIPILGEWIGEHQNGTKSPASRFVSLACENSAETRLEEGSLDAVFTDPPYFGNVQYAELMDFCYTWLRRLIGSGRREFAAASTRNPEELTGNETLERGIEHFTDGLSSVFSKMARALKPGSPLVFTFHHNRLETYAPVAVSILDAGLTCSASLPCPAEMGASIHISGTGSSVVDTVFVCRSTGTTRRRWIVFEVDSLASLIAAEMQEMAAAGLRPTKGDLRCVAYGHLTRLAVWLLRSSWRAAVPPLTKIRRVMETVEKLPRLPALEAAVERETGRLRERQTPYVFDTSLPYGANDEFIAF